MLTERGPCSSKLPAAEATAVAELVLRIWNKPEAYSFGMNTIEVGALGENERTGGICSMLAPVCR